MLLYVKALGMSILIGILIFLLMFIGTGKDQLLGSVIMALLGFFGSFISFLYEKSIIGSLNRLIKK
ncbi:hypothetical protein AAA450_09310 [Staphylococcus equorum]|uniref:hypothetical protein n=1 Tax=Staphylococcus equorum TaxID=246432 RepID=UPI003D8076AE